MHVIDGGVSPEYLVEFSQAHDRAGFDLVLVGYTSTAADGWAVATHAAANTERVGYLIAHRPMNDALAFGDELIPRLKAGAKLIDGS